MEKFKTQKSQIHGKVRDTEKLIEKLETFQSQRHGKVRYTEKLETGKS